MKCRFYGEQNLFSVYMMASIPSHHVKEAICSSRPPYREGRDPKAVKVYTVSSESKYLLVRGVPINHGEDLAPIFSMHGEIDEIRGIGDYPEKEQFTEVFLIKYKHIQASRFAKRKLDELSFFGGCLHVCYGPEYESVAETRTKLQQRRKIIAIKTNQSEDNCHQADSRNPKSINEASTASHQPEQNLELRYKPIDFLRATSVVPLVPNLSVPPPVLPRPSVPPPPAPLLPPPPLPPPTNYVPSIPSTLPPARSEESFEQYSLLPPPRRVPLELQPRKVKKTRFECAKVMSAQAMFPVGFDARLLSQDVSTDSQPQQVPMHNKSSCSSEGKATNAKLTEGASSSDSNAQPVIGKQVNANITGKSPLVIRDVKKKMSSVPKFIPRQAIPKVKVGPREEDKLDKALRASAVQLGTVQGPELPQEMQPISKEMQKSLDETRQTIRKRVSQLSDAEKPVVTQKMPKIENE